MNLSFVFIIFCSQLNVIIKCDTSVCENFKTCSACIQSLDKCLWCPAENHVGKRCQSQNYHQHNSSWCTSNITIPKINSYYTENKNWTSEGDVNIVQIRPQRVVITSASPGIPINITISYKPAKDEPLDVYYLMDNTEDIKKYRDSLRKEATSIFAELKKHTNNVRLGIGTFVDKPALPYANPDVHNAYCFKNDLSLTNDTNIFETTLGKIQNGSNYDRPEAVLDGLIQAMLCANDIHWRNGGRRFIVVVTNAFYHTAGNGKMIGALKRHDMKCHIDGAMDTVMDYPSISQVNKVAKDGGFVIIFAVTNDQKESYKLLSKNIIGAKYVILNDTNIADIITKEYIKVIENIHITHNASSSLRVITEKVCKDCKAMHYQPMDLVTTFKVLSCPNPPRPKEFVKITPTSLNDGLIVEVEFNCHCECEQHNFTEFKSTKCNNNGDYQCGICKCHPNRYGEYCTCEGNSVNSKDDIEKCKKSTNDIFECSGHGECRCGVCGPCHKGFSGQFCEFDDNSCTRRDGKLCSGHGQCTLGKCQCDRMWESLPDNDDCGCIIDKTPCIAPHSDKVCSGNGVCKCGMCTCNPKQNSSDTCKGRYCDKCQLPARCEELEAYAYCKYLNKTTCNEEYNKTDTKVVFANRSEINSARNAIWYMANLCRVKKEEDESIFIFKYYYSSEETDTEGGSDESTLVLVIQKELDEMPPANIWVAIGSSIGGILLIGLLTLLLWKVLTDFYDAREYNQFVEKARAAGYNVNMTDNPWYEPPVQTFSNPVYTDK